MIIQKKHSLLSTKPLRLILPATWHGSTEAFYSKRNKMHVALDKPSKFALTSTKNTLQQRPTSPFCWNGLGMKLVPMIWLQGRLCSSQVTRRLLNCKLDAREAVNLWKLKKCLSTNRLKLSAKHKSRRSWKKPAQLTEKLSLQKPSTMMTEMKTLSSVN